jgi:transcriptional regulator with GAF, ATPase, and Fis domain
MISETWRVLLDGLSASEQPQRTLVALEQICKQNVGHILFTVLLYDPERREHERFYSSHPDAYPVSGRKPLSDGPWASQVIEKRQPFVANTIEEIATVFKDHELIRSLGCGSVLNLPVVFGGSVIGTVNLLEETGYYTPERVAQGMSLLPEATAALIATSWKAR